MKVTSNSLLQIEGLTVTYPQTDGTPVRALEGIHLSIAPGEIVGVLGESGCGKSTLANAVVGLLPRTAIIDAGKISFKGINLIGMSESELRPIRGHKVSLMRSSGLLDAASPQLHGAWRGLKGRTRAESGLSNRRSWLWEGANCSPSERTFS